MIYKFQKKKKKKRKSLAHYAELCTIRRYTNCKGRWTLFDRFVLINRKKRTDCLFFSSLRADELMVFEMDVVVRALLSRLKLPSSPFYPFASNFHLDPLSFHFDASIIPRPMFYYLRGNRTCTYNGIKVIFNHSIDGSIHYAA